MYNSNNSVVRKDYFTGTLIAQAKLLGFQTDLNQVNPSELSDIIHEKIASKVSTVPMFLESQIERVQLSDNTKETFARIGKRVRKEFIEEQIARADKYSIPYNAYTVNFLELKQKIDEYEELLKKAKDYCIDWDKLEYDPVALRQEIEEQEHRALYENDDLYAYFVQSRGLEA